MVSMNFQKIIDIIFSFSKKNNRKRPKKLFFSGSDPENKKINNSLELAVIHFILLLISETILASSRTEHRYLHSLQFTSSVYFTI